VRNPLAALRMRVENLAETVPDLDGAEAEAALAEIDRLARICDSFVALARADAPAVEPVAVVPAELVRDRLAAWSPAARREGVVLAAGPLDPCELQVGPGIVDQVLDILLDNAIRHAGRGTSVTVAVRREEPGVMLEVTDDGPGLPPELMNTGIVPFWQRLDSGPRSGSGLGLAIAVTLLERSGGTLDLTAALPHGVCARVRVPA
jgi:signal transduction histidine kinase